MKQIVLTAEKIAEITGGTLYGDPKREINEVSGIKDAAANHLSFAGNKKQCTRGYTACFLRYINFCIQKS